MAVQFNQNACRRSAVFSSPEGSNSLQREDVVPVDALTGNAPESREMHWRLDSLAGRFVEITGGASTAALSVVTKLVLNAQHQGKHVAWIGNTASVFYPPDFHASGIDLEALPVIRVAHPSKAARVADVLIRSSSFSLIVLDLGSKAEISLSTQTRLVGLVHQYSVALVNLTQNTRHTPSRFPLVSLRLNTGKKRSSHRRFEIEMHALKDKRRRPDWRVREICHATGGLC